MSQWWENQAWRRLCDEWKRYPWEYAGEAPPDIAVEALRRIAGMYGPGYPPGDIARDALERLGLEVANVGRPRY